MRNIRLILCLLILALTLTACDGQQTPETEAAPQTAAPTAQAESTMQTEAVVPEETTGEVPATEPGVSMAAIYEKMTVNMPEMVEMDEAMRLNYCGISQEDVSQAVVAICADGLRADEIWLIQAVDEAAAVKIGELAQTRLKAKEDETRNYAPDQFAVVENAELLQEGPYVALLVSPEAKTLTEIFRQEIG